MGRLHGIEAPTVATGQIWALGPNLGLVGPFWVADAGVRQPSPPLI
jgi:hypothetical protein